jgi:hypothetical protein
MKAQETNHKETHVIQGTFAGYGQEMVQYREAKRKVKPEKLECMKVSFRIRQCASTALQ